MMRAFDNLPERVILRAMCFASFITNAALLFLIHVGRDLGRDRWVQLVPPPHSLRCS